MDMGYIIAVDPGTGKCGLAVVNKHGVLEHLVVARRETLAQMAAWLTMYAVDTIVIGDGTGSRQFVAELTESYPAWGKLVQLVDERFSTEEARKRYFKEHPPRWLARLLPVTMLTPPCPVDDYVAVLLAERYLSAGDRE
jgi:RNase H-fold protein (predicted Holliday junction resolvase)